MTKLTICMYGAASDRIDSIYINAAEALGKEIAKRHHKLIYGGGASGLMGSWVGIVFWNAMSQRLPTALAGQMIVFETIFAVTYAHVLRMQWPEWNMLAGMALLLSGVMLSLKVFQTAKAQRRSESV